MILSSRALARPGATLLRNVFFKQVSLQNHANVRRERNSKHRTLETSWPVLEHRLRTYAQDVWYTIYLNWGTSAKWLVKALHCLNATRKKTGDLTVLSCIPQTPKIVYDRLMETDGSITHILHEYTQNHPREDIPTQLRSRAPRRFVPPQRHCLTVGETCLTQIGKDRLTQHINGCVT